MNSTCLWWAEKTLGAERIPGVRRSLRVLRSLRVRRTLRVRRILRARGIHRRVIPRRISRWLRNVTPVHLESCFRNFDVLIWAFFSAFYRKVSCHVAMENHYQSITSSESDQGPSSVDYFTRLCTSEFGNYSSLIANINIITLVGITILFFLTFIFCFFLLTVIITTI